MNVFDRAVLLWLNGLTGNVAGFDGTMQLIAGDYLVPLFLSLVLMGLWLSGASQVQRELRQKAAIVGAASIGLSNLAVLLLNLAWFRPRPFVELGDQVNLLFYPATDPSFPANPIAVVFAGSAAVWAVHRRLASVMFAISIVFAFARLYLGAFYLTDLIAGAAVGFAVTYGVSHLRRIIEPVPTLFLRFGRAICVA